MKNGSIVILDFGSQYNQLIARRVREMGVYAEVVPFHEDIDKILERKPKGIILSGGPASVYAKGAPTLDKRIFDANIPILGLCYGMQLITHLYGGEVERADKQEFGKASLKLDKKDSLIFKNIPDNTIVWMSHADHVNKMAEGFEIIAHTDSSIAAIENRNKKIYAFQYHPEVTHSEHGFEMLKNFVFEIVGAEKNWSMENYIETTVKEIKEKVGDKKVILGLSGGVDSSVAAMLINKAIGKQLTCIFVDTGLLRKNEAKHVMDVYAQNFDMDIKCINEEERFLSKLKGVEDPEEKRKIIGKEFIEVFNEEAIKLKDAEFLAQGTIYPDVIESVSVKGPSVTIKSHHNVGGLPEDLNFKLLEPLRELFKDEVRKVGRELGIPDYMVDRHPFPGPGLGIRILGEVTKEKADILREADDIFIEELRKEGLYSKVSQAFVVLLPVKSVGVMGDERTYEYTAVLRSANTIDFMTATWSRIPYEFLEKVSNRILNEVKGINRLTYDISSKPPATIEWE